MTRRWLACGSAALLLLSGAGGDEDLQIGDVFATFVESGTAARYFVPTDDSVDELWTDPEFDDSGWTEGPIGMGYDSSERYLPYIATDLTDAMRRVSATVYLRIEFDIDELPPDGTPTLSVRLDDAFIAYLNGVEIARSQFAPENADWTSNALGNQDEDLAEAGVEFSSNDWRSLLQPGKNVLAVHGLNSSDFSADFLLEPTLQLKVVEPGFEEVLDHPLSGRFGTRGLLALRAFAGKIYMGYGEWNDHPGPIVLYSYDPSDGVVRAEHTINTDSIERLVVADGRLWIPSIDPIHFNRFTDVSILHPDGRLEQRTPVGFLHVFDVLERQNGDVLLLGSKTANEWSDSGGSVFRSSDAGESWEEFDPNHGGSRFYAGREDLEGNLLLTTSPTHIKRAVVHGEIGDVRVQIHANYFQRNHPSLSPAGRSALDFAVDGDCVYLLQSGGSIVYCRDVAAPDLDWETLATFVPGGSSRIDALDGALYVGTNSGGLWVRPKLDAPTVPATTFDHALPESSGAALALFENTLIVGAPTASGTEIQSGKIYCFKRSDANAPWQGAGELVAPTENVGGLFGDSVAIEDDTLMIVESGVFTSRDRGDGAILHTFQRDGEGFFEHTLESERQFAQTVALGGGYYCFARRTILQGSALAGGNLWSRSASNVGYEPFGAVALAPREDGDVTVVFGASGDVSRNGAPGAAYVYEAGGDPPAISAGQVLRSTTGSFERFGFSVASAGGVIAVGAPRADIAALQAGAVHLYREDPSGGTPFLEDVLTAPFAEAEDDFGHSVALSPAGDRLLVGAPLARGAGGRRGAVFRYEHGPDGWTSQRTYYPPEDEPAIWEFGVSVVFDGDTGIVGSGFADEAKAPLERLQFIDLTAPPLTTYELWAGAHGLVAPDDAYEADPDGDGASNLEAFAFDLPAGGLRVELQDGLPSVIFHRRVDAQSLDLTYRVEASAALEEWQEVDTENAELQRVGGWERFMLPWPDGAAFVRCAVELTP